MNKKIQEILEKNTTDCMGVKQVNHDAFARDIIYECMRAVEITPRHLAYTSYDYGLVNATIKKCKASVKEHFNL